MDYPTAIAIAIPASTFVIMVSRIFIKKKNPPGDLQVGDVTRKELDGLLKEKLDVSLCEERVKRIEGLVSALRGFIEQQFRSMSKRLDRLEESWQENKKDK